MVEQLLMKDVTLMRQLCIISGLLTILHIIIIAPLFRPHPHILQLTYFVVKVFQNKNIKLNEAKL